MKRSKFFILISSALALGAFSCGLDLAGAQQEGNPNRSTLPIQEKTWNLNLAAEQAIAERAAQGLSRSTSNTQRRAAAERTKVRQGSANLPAPPPPGVQGGGK